MSTAPARRPARVPAEPELWILIFGDLAVFTVFFFLWAFGQRAHPAAFADGRASLDLAVATTNTVALLGSSVAVVLAVAHVRHRRVERARACYAIAIGLGLLFLALKGVEYAEHLAHGPGALTGTFYLYYFVFTGVHALHVTLGLIGLTVCRARARRREEPPALLVHEAVASYWHTIDVVWIVLFTLIYLA